MVFEIGPTEGLSAALSVVKLIKYLVLVMEDETSETGRLSEIAILTGGHKMARALEMRDEKVSKRYIYLITETERDAKKIEQELLKYTSDNGYEYLKNALRALDSDFTSFCWEHAASLDFFAQDIADMLTASTLILPGEAHQKCFRGTTSWIES